MGSGLASAREEAGYEASLGMRLATHVLSYTLHINGSIKGIIYIQ